LEPGRDNFEDSEGDTPGGALFGKTEKGEAIVFSKARLPSIVHEDLVTIAWG